MKKNTCLAETKSTANHQLLLKLKRVFCTLFFSLALVTVSYAEIWQKGANQYEAGIGSAELQILVRPESAGIQRQDMWCWAASIQMVLNYHGLYVTQEQIVQLIKGQLINDGGTHAEMMSALNRWGIDYQGRYRVVSAYSGVTTHENVINALAYKYPLIAERTNGGSIGHAVVLTAVGFHFVSAWNGYGYVNTPVIDYAVFRDPWGRNGTPSRQIEDWTTFESKLLHLDHVFVSK